MDRENSRNNNNNPIYSVLKNYYLVKLIFDQVPSIDLRTIGKQSVRVRDKSFGWLVQRNLHKTIEYNLAKSNWELLDFDNAFFTLNKSLPLFKGFWRAVHRDAKTHHYFFNVMRRSFQIIDCIVATTLPIVRYYHQQITSNLGYYQSSGLVNGRPAPSMLLVSSKGIENLIKYGSWEIMEYLIQNQLIDPKISTSLNTPTKEKLLLWACEFGVVEMVHYFSELFNLGFTSYLASPRFTEATKLNESIIERVSMAIQKGKMDILKKYLPTFIHSLERPNYLVHSRLLEDSCKSGSWECIEFVYTTIYAGNSLSENQKIQTNLTDLIVVALSHGHLDIAKRLAKLQDINPAITISQIRRRPRTDVIGMLDSTPSILNSIVEKGNVETMKWIKEVKLEKDFTSILEYAIHHKKQDIIDWAIENKFVQPSSKRCDALVELITVGSQQKQLMQQKQARQHYPIQFKIQNYLLHDSNHYQIQLIQNNNYLTHMQQTILDINSIVIKISDMAPHMNISYTSLNNMVKVGNVEALKFLLEFRKIQKERKDKYTAKKIKPPRTNDDDGMEVYYDYYNDFGEPVVNDLDQPIKLSLTDAVDSGDIDMVRFISEHPDKIGTATKRTLDRAAEYGHLDIVHYLHYNRSEGCTADAMEKSARAGHYDVVRFLHFNRTEGCGWSGMNLAATNGHLPVVEFLYYNRTEHCTKEALDGAISNNHYEVVQFLLSKPELGLIDEINEITLFEAKWTNYKMCKLLLSQFEFTLSGVDYSQLILQTNGNQSTLELFSSHPKFKDNTQLNQLKSPSYQIIKNADDQEIEYYFKLN